MYPLTGLKKTPESLLMKTPKESQQAPLEDYRLINENMKDVIWQTTPELVITYVTSSVKKLLGYEAQELIGQPLTSLLTPEAREIVLKLIPDIIRSLAEHQEFETEVSVVELIRKDGKTVWTETTTEQTLDAGGKFLGFQGVTWDISERKKAEDALRESERFLRQSEKIARTGGWKANPYTDSLHWTEGVYDIVEAPKDHQPDLDQGLEFFTPPYRRILKEAIAKTIELGEPFTIEAEVMTSSGRRLWTEVRGLMRLEVGDEPQVVGSFQDITERKLAEDALQKSEDKFSKVFQYGPALITLSNVDDGTYVEVNDKFCEVSGFTRADCIGKTAIDFGWISPEERKRLFDELNIHGSVRGIGLEVRSKDKRELHLIYNGELLQTANGKLLLSMAHDITDRKLAEEALRTSENKYRLLFDTAPIGIILVDREGNILEANNYIIETLGSPGPEATKSLNMLTFPPLVEAGMSSILDSCMEENRPVDTEICYTSKWGRTMCLRIILTPKLNDRGHVTGCLAVMEDVSKRQLAEQALRVSESKFRTLFETAQDAIFIKDLELKYVDINAAGLELFQSGRHNLIGRTSAEFFGEDYPAEQDKLERRVIQGQAVETYLNWEFKSQPISLHLTRFPLRDSQGEIMGICGVAREIFNSPYASANQSNLANDSKSETMQSTLAKVRLVSETDSIVLLTGETGSGKDYLARHIHKLSGRSTGPFYAINCAAIPSELAESELFGHEPGAYTNALRRKKGMLEMAEGGTLLLNEIGELTPLLQAKLLTFLDTFSITRIGGEKTISVNTRLIAATNRDLWTEVNEGRFRKDLYYRLSVISIEVPPLRERSEDIPVIANRILVRLREELKLSSVPDIRADAMRALLMYSWPGNVRELRNVLERALMLSRGDTICPNHLSVPQTQRVWGAEKRSVSTGCSLNDVLKETERLMIEDALGRSGGNKSEAARLLGISRFALLRHMTKLGISER
jgi:PAS domain S-box-containing protein